MNKMTVLIFLMLYMTAGLTQIVSAGEPAPSLIIEKAWVKAMPPTADYSAAFMRITNRSGRDVTLVKVKSGLSKTVEIHQMYMKKGTMRMRPAKNLVIRQGETVTLEPGSTHIMLIDLIKPLTDGATTDLVLVMKDGTEQTVSAKIMKEGFDDEAQSEEDNKNPHEGHAHGQP